MKRTFVNVEAGSIVLGGLGSSGGAGAGAAASALVLRIDLVIIIRLKGGQFDGHAGATVTGGGGAAAGGAAALGALIVVVIKVGIETGPGRIGSVTLDGGAQDRGSQGPQQLRDDAVCLLVDLLQQPRIEVVFGGDIRILIPGCVRACIEIFGVFGIRREIS